MHREYLLVDNCCYRQAIEAVGECLPQLDVISSLAFIVEAVYAVDRCTLVISTQDKKILRILDLVGEKQADCFKRLFAPINVVSKEEIVCFGWKTSVFKEAKKVIVLAVNITTDLRLIEQRVSVELYYQKKVLGRTIEEVYIP